MSECSYCRRKLVNFEECVNCSVKFHKNCLAKHALDCNNTATSFQENANMCSSVGSSISSPRSALNVMLPDRIALLQMSNLNTALALPNTGHTLNHDQKSTIMMETLLEVRHQNTQIKKDLAAT